MNSRTRWTLLAIALLSAILVPFVLFEKSALDWTNGLLSQRGSLSVAIAIVVLLALDILLPIPSSIVSTASGALLGFVGGTLVSAAGMTLGCLLGYGLGAGFARGSGKRFIGERELAKVAPLWGQYGGSTLVLLRAVPVLAEASTFFAGMARMSLARYLFVTGLCNLCISAVYAAAGSYALSGRAFILAFSVAIGLPLVAILVTKRIRPEAGAAGSTEI